MDRSLDEIIGSGSKGKGGRGAFSTGGGKGGKRGYKDGGGKDRQFNPYKGKGRGRGRVFFEPSVDNAWVHDKFDSGGDRRRQFHKPPKERQHYEIDCKVYIKNLPWTWEDSDVKAILEGVEHVNLYYDASGRPKGTAMATFPTPEAAIEAVGVYDGAKLDNNIISLSLAKSSNQDPQPNRTSGGFGAPQSRWKPPRQPEEQQQPQPASGLSPDQLDAQLQQFIATKDNEQEPAPEQENPVQDQQQMEE
eukprot:TRINITY_DN16732_c2_g2_i2.p1 TRINITY_DN16732_c2_g2~~TRINITY_DN16732_c2_g2_i2.p1  ORF type:complete len:248 (+),score=58.55 TRINITY_DN16732_c2_g2_i2:274-1017(+)